ncbi:sulfite exporter TauE/SafE family protein [Corynebacterium sp. p3-SID1056]|uniref:sulfite exporter TauE/SafE family protein n=1 Tax=Corynebacterium sp. p3-SID1056 TaxID=2916092 RepID=UPI0021A83A3D|nr:sulfite exporter TauE/SafE family protein [Corynebacterium sp. p3-SID1056]MCT2339410.1 sulfite exporter TauE/SafE family protein [Corynebacterium sp. p3-SID1056]
MEPVSALLLFVMAIMAGAINSAVGSGSLLTLPVLMALGLPPGVAVRTNTTGMVFASFGSVLGYRKEIARELPYLAPMVVVTILASATGSLLLLASPSSTLDFVVPVLIVVALLMVIFQPKLAAWLSRRSAAATAEDAPAAGAPVGQAWKRPQLIAPMGAAAIYGGYFTAAQGILYMAITSVATGRSLKDVNPVKNFLSLFVNITAAVVYLVAWIWFDAEIVWIGVAIVAVGGLIGGVGGSHIAKRLPNSVLRGIIVVVALAALVRQFV